MRDLPLKGISTNFTHQSLFTSLWMYDHITLRTDFCGSTGSCAQSDKLPQLMSLEAKRLLSEVGIYPLKFPTNDLQALHVDNAKCKSKTWLTVTNLSSAAPLHL